MSSALLRVDWPASKGVVAFTTLRGDPGLGASCAPFQHFNLGARCGDAADAVARNRATLCDLAAVPAEPRWLRQVHGAAVLRADHPLPSSKGSGQAKPVAPAAEKDKPATTTLPPLPLAGEGWGEGGAAEEPEADAAVTAQAGTVLAILTADCLPVLFCAVDGGEVAAAHAGWRGLAAGVLENTVAAMRAPAGNVMAWLGPAAGPQAYEIGVEVRAAFVDADARAAQAFVATRSGHWHVDLYALARQRLSQVGVTRVYGGGLCTISDPQRFFSHRRDGRSGRMASLIWISGRA